MEMQASWESILLALAGDMPHPSTRPLFSYWAGDAGLQKSYRVCRQITSQNSKSFYLASSLLPEEKRLAVHALYAFCRTIDDIVDETSADGRQHDLNRWRRIVRTLQAPDDDPVALAWVDTINRYHIPTQYAQQLLDGVNRDLTQTRYQTFDDLATYCYGVASTVGLMSMYIVGFRSKEAVSYAIRLGVALQMTNILRDVGEDFRNGRIYLPQDELSRFGLCESDLAAGTVTDNWRAFMRFQIERTRRLYAEAWPGVKMLESDGQFSIGAAATFYSGILDDIEAHDYDVFSRRAHLSTWGKLKRLPGLWATLSTQ
jgi:phytoene synthase